MPIRLKRVYDSPTSADGKRVLVDRIWPRGLTKDAARIDFWAKATSPSTELRQWYRHDPEKWPEFRERFFAELDENSEGVEELLEHVGTATVTFVFSSREARLNNANALKEYVEARTTTRRRKA